MFLYSLGGMEQLGLEWRNLIDRWIQRDGIIRMVRIGGVMCGSVF